MRNTGEKIGEHRIQLWGWKKIQSIPSWKRRADAKERGEKFKRLEGVTGWREGEEDIEKRIE